MIHHGNLTITKHNAADFAALTSVGGYLYIDADAQLPALTSVGGYLYINAEAQLPALTSVGGYLYINADAQLPALTSVGGDLYINADAQLPALTSVGGYLDINADAQLPALTSVGGHALPSSQDADARIRRIAEIVLSNGDALQMNDWHTCDTTHCLAGWAIHNEGEAGYALERETSSATAGAILLGVEAASKFFKDNDAVMTWLRSKVEVAA